MANPAAETPLTIAVPINGSHIDERDWLPPKADNWAATARPQVMTAAVNDRRPNSERLSIASVRWAVLGECSEAGPSRHSALWIRPHNS